VSERFGLDFGTTNSSLAWARAGEPPSLCALDERAANPHVLRSLLYYSLEERGFVVGQRAIDEYLAEDMQGTLVQSVKTFLADDSFEETWVYDRFYKLEDLIAVALQHVRAAIRALGIDDVHLVIGRPAVFVERPERENLARDRMRKAAALAGFTDVTFAYEPIAAGLAYEASLSHPEVALIADLGGGTSDFTVMRLGTGRTGDRRSDILATGGVQIGGDTFDARIMARRITPHFGAGTTYRSMEGRDLPFPSHVLARLERWHHVPFLRDRRTRELLARLRETASEPDAVARLQTLVESNLSFFLFEQIERVKAELSSKTETVLRFTEGGMRIEEPISRKEFDALIAPDRATVARCMHAVLEKAGLAPAAVESVFMTGGSAQIPTLRGLFAETFGEHKLRARDYLTTVASGLAQAPGGD
jgi:hypothetical chaperone protein